MVWINNILKQILCLYTFYVQNCAFVAYKTNKIYREISAEIHVYIDMNAAYRNDRPPNYFGHFFLVTLKIAKIFHFKENFQIVSI